MFSLTCGHAIDLDGNGSPDLLFRNKVTGELRFAQMSGFTMGNAVSIGTMDLNWAIIGVADVDKDGDDDIIWRHRADGVVRIWHLESGAHTSTSEMRGFSEDWRFAGVGQFSLSGPASLLWHNASNGQIGIRHLSTAPNDSFHPIGALPGPWFVAQVSDLRDTVIDELVIRNPLTNSLADWSFENGVATRFSMQMHKFKDWDFVGIGQLNKDEIKDVVWFNPYTRMVHFSLSSASNTWGSRVMTDVVDAGTRPVEVNDYDRNGESDILMQDMVTGRLKFWKMAYENNGNNWSLNRKDVVTVEGLGPDWVVSNSAAIPHTPVFVRQLSSAVADEGGMITFSCEVNASSGVEYQWYRNGEPIPGATASSYSVHSVQTQDISDIYHVEAKDYGGSMRSDNFRIELSNEWWVDWVYPLDSTTARPLLAVGPQVLHSSYKTKPLLRVVAAMENGSGGYFQFGEADVIPFQGFEINMMSKLKNLDVKCLVRGLNEESTLADLCDAGKGNYHLLVKYVYDQNGSNRKYSGINANVNNMGKWMYLVSEGLLSQDKYGFTAFKSIGGQGFTGANDSILANPGFFSVHSRFQTTNSSSSVLFNSNSPLVSVYSNDESRSVFINGSKKGTSINNQENRDMTWKCFENLEVFKDNLTLVSASENISITPSSLSNFGVFGDRNLTGGVAPGTLTYLLLLEKEGNGSDANAIHLKMSSQKNLESKQFTQEEYVRNYEPDWAGVFDMGIFPATYYKDRSGPSYETSGAGFEIVSMLTESYTGMQQFTVVCPRLDYNFEKVSNSLFVATSGNDTTGDGTEEYPLRTIKKALSLIGNNPGIIYIRGGVYEEPLDITNYTTSKDHPLIIAAYDKETVQIKQPENWQMSNRGKATVSLRASCENVWLYRLHIYGCKGRPDAPVLTNIEDNNGISLSNGGGRNARIINCNVYHVQHCGYKDLNQTHGALKSGGYIFEGCIAYDSGAVDHRDHGFYFQPATQGLRNTFRGCMAIKQIGQGYNFYVNPIGIEVYNCVAVESQIFSGINMAGRDNRIFNCVTYNNKVSGFNLYRGNCQGNQIFNMISANNNGSQILGFELESNSGNLVDYLCTFPRELGGEGAVETMGSVFGAHMISADPLFENAEEYDFRLQSGSPCKGKGKFEPWMADCIEIPL